MFEKINILEALQEERREIHSRKILNEVREILHDESIEDANILKSIRERKSAVEKTEIKNPDPDKIFSEEAIKNICIKYRLRFLDADLFKGEIPYEAILKSKQISKTAKAELNHFKIMAPARLFQLRDADADPLLFVPTADGNYYLIHKWGTDLAWYKKITQFPTRTLGSLVITILFFALMIALFIPNEWLIPKSFLATNNIFGYWGFHRIAFFFHATILICGITIFWWFTFHKNFSSAEWNKKTFN